MDVGPNIRCEKEMQLGGSHDHPINLHICSGSASGPDFDVASVAGAKQHEPHRPKLRSRRGKIAQR